MTATAKKYENIKYLVLQIANGCHRKIIGKSGQKIKELQTKFDVRINLPRDGGDEVSIEGSEESCLDCQEILLDIEEEWEQEEAEYAARRGEKATGGEEKAASVDAPEFLRTPFSQRTYANPEPEKKKAPQQKPWVLPTAGAAASSTAMTAGPWGRK